jgi:hypothetical protein
MSTARFDTLSNSAGTSTVPVNTVVNGSAKAWVNFNGTGTVAIRAAFNVSSITDNGTGDYTVNFTTAMPDVNYSAAGMSAEALGTPFNRLVVVNTMTTSALRIAVQAPNFSNQDTNIVMVNIFR